MKSELQRAKSNLFGEVKEIARIREGVTQRSFELEIAGNKREYRKDRSWGEAELPQVCFPSCFIIGI